MQHCHHIATYYERLLTREERNGWNARRWRQLHEMYHVYKQAALGRMLFAAP